MTATLGKILICMLIFVDHILRCLTFPMHDMISLADQIRVAGITKIVVEVEIP